MNLDVYYDDKGFINNDTPVCELDTQTTSGVTYIRWQNSTEDIFIKAVDETGSTIVIGFAKGAWADRASLTYLGYYEYKSA
jgi:hypothetical protein